MHRKAEDACDTCKCQRHEADVPKEEPERKTPPRRPPYAVTYATPSRQFRILVPGDCSVTAEGGALVIRHVESVTAIAGVQPYYTREA